MAGFFPPVFYLFPELPLSELEFLGIGNLHIVVGVLLRLSWPFLLK